MHAQSKNLERNVGEPSLAFFSRITAITKLASFHLEGQDAREAYKHNNVREQFLRNINKRFQYLIKQREIVNSVCYTPAELFRMHLTFEQFETDNKGVYTINKINNDLDLTQAFPSMHGKQKGSNPQPQLRRQGAVSKKQQSSCYWGK